MYIPTNLIITNRFLIYGDIPDFFQKIFSLQLKFLDNCEGMCSTYTFSSNLSYAQGGLSEQCFLSSKFLMCSDNIQYWSRAATQSLAPSLQVGTGYVSLTDTKCLPNCLILNLCFHRVAAKASFSHETLGRYFRSKL